MPRYILAVDKMFGIEAATEEDAIAQASDDLGLSEDHFVVLEEEA